MNPNLSIIVPVYNVEKYLRECVDSILAQSFQDFEVILVDDGSPDMSGQICDEYAAKYPDKIRVVHKANGGLSSARNAGLDVARGKYISFIDSDDVILPGMYSEMLDVAKTHDADIVYSKFLPWETQADLVGDTEPIIMSGRDSLIAMFHWERPVTVCTSIFKNDIIGDTRFPYGLLNEDFPFSSVVLQKASKVAVLNKGYYRYRVNQASICQNFKDSYFDIFENIEFVRAHLPNNDASLKKAFQHYEMTMHIMSGVRIVKSKLNKKYKHWLRRNRKHILKNWTMLVGGGHLSLRWRLKALYTFIRLPKG